MNCRIGQCFAMCDVLRRHGSNGGRKVAKDFPLTIRN
jgi:hypothetical protein